MTLFQMLQNIVLGGAAVIALASLYEFTTRRMSR
jgi:hypothetical protein